MTEPNLRGDRVTMRLLAESDMPSLLEILHQPGVAEWWPCYDMARLRADTLDDPNSTSLAVELDGVFVGLVILTEQTDPYYKSAGIDITLDITCVGPGARRRHSADGGALPLRGTRASPSHHRSVARQRARHPGVRAGRLQAHRCRPPVREGRRRHVPRQPADGHARRRTAVAANAGAVQSVVTCRRRTGAPAHDRSLHPPRDGPHLGARRTSSRSGRRSRSSRARRRRSSAWHPARGGRADPRARGASRSSASTRSRRRLNHDVIAFLTNMAEHIGEPSKWVHYGMTELGPRRHRAVLPDDAGAGHHHRGRSPSRTRSASAARSSSATRSASAARTASTPSR